MRRFQLVFGEYLSHWQLYNLTLFDIVKMSPTFLLNYSRTCTKLNDHKFNLIVLLILILTCLDKSSSGLFRSFLKY